MRIIIRRSIIIIISCFFLILISCQQEAVQHSDNQDFYLSFFCLRAEDNPLLQSDILGKIRQEDIEITLPYAADASYLIAEFLFLGDGLFIDGVEQQSRISIVDLSEEPLYQLHSKDKIKNYQLKLFFADPSEARITDFRFETRYNNHITASPIAQISGPIISLKLPETIDTSSLCPSFSCNGQYVERDGTVLSSGESRLDFTSPLLLRAYAFDGSIAEYTVVINQDLEQEAALAKTLDFYDQQEQALDLEFSSYQGEYEINFSDYQIKAKISALLEETNLLLRLNGHDLENTKLPAELTIPLQPGKNRLEFILTKSGKLDMSYTYSITTPLFGAEEWTDSSWLIDQASTDSLAGSAMAESDNWLFVSAPADENATSAQKCGSVLIYQFDGFFYQFIQKIYPPDIFRGAQQFGHALAAVEDRLFIGAPGFNNERGAIFSYRYNPDETQWQLQEALTPSVEEGARLGHSLAADFSKKPLLLAGAPGADSESGRALLLEFNPDGMLEHQNIIIPEEAAPGNNYGAAIALDSENIFLGGPKADSGKGKVQNFVLNNGFWIHNENLKTENELSGGFGSCIQVQNDLLLISAPLEDSADTAETGAVYLYQGLPSRSWQLLEKITSPLPSSHTFFGKSLYLDQNQFLISGPGYNSEAETGQVFFYEWNESQLSVKAGFLHPRSQIQTSFGKGLLILDNHVCISAPGENSPGGGEIFFFTLKN